MSNLSALLLAILAIFIFLIAFCYAVAWADARFSKTVSSIDRSLKELDPRDPP